VTEEKKLTAIEKVLFLKSVDIFEHATVEQLGAIAALTEEIDFEPEKLIYRQGEPADGMYLILRGRVAVESSGRVLREIGEKQAIGTVAGLDLCPVVHNVKAIESVHALKLDIQDFHDLLSLDFELVKAVFRVLCRLIREAQSMPRNRN
jgi:CRP/FNR family transcriptional regulator, cyclic AMP receptor protein